MRTMFSCCLMTMAVLLTPAVSAGDENSHRKAAETLLLVMGVDKNVPKLAEQVLEGQLQQHPQLAPQREVMQRFLHKYLHWDSVKEETITAYTHEFTEKELKQLMAFYQTPVGKKASEKMTKLAFVSGQIGLQRAQEHQAELRQMIDAEKTKKTP